MDMFKTVQELMCAMSFCYIKNAIKITTNVVNNLHASLRYLIWNMPANFMLEITLSYIAL